MTPDPATVAAMAAHLITTYCPAGQYEDAAETVQEWSEEAAQVADRLIAEAVAAERQRILDAIARQMSTFPPLARLTARGQGAYAELVDLERKVREVTP